MELKAFTIHDSCADVFMTPFFLKNEAQAQRVFRAMVNNQNEQMSAAPGDFTLFEIGTWSDDEGSLTPCYLKSHGTGLSYITE